MELCTSLSRIIQIKTFGLGRLGRKEAVSKTGRVVTGAPEFAMLAACKTVELN